MSMFRKATRLRAKLRLALVGPAGSGKTWTSLALATEIARQMRAAGLGQGRIAVIDSESGSAELYANRFDFDTMALERHSPTDYVKAIEAAEGEGYDIGVIDSLSHAWIGKDGALAQVDQLVERGAGNSFSAWRHVTPKHNQLVDKLLSCKMHLITTIRAKTEYVQEKDEKGKTQIKKLGMAAIQRDGLEYEFTLVGDLDLSNTLKISKTRLDGVIRPGDIFERPGAELGAKIFGWLQDGVEVKPSPPAPPPADAVGDKLAEVFTAYLDQMRAATDLVELDRIAAGPAKPEKGTPEHGAATKVYLERRGQLEKAGAA